MLGVGLLDRVPMVGQRRHSLDRSGDETQARERYVGPVRLEAELAVGPRKPFEIVRGFEVRLAIDPTLGLELGERAPP